MVHVLTTSVADGGEDDRVIKPKSVISNVQEEPRPCCAEKEFSKPPLAVIRNEIVQGCLGDNEISGSFSQGCDAGDFIWVAFGSARHVSIDIRVCFLNITSDVESVTWGLWDGETVVESNAAWYRTETTMRC